MTLFHAFILGIIQGLTEFIPVSSTAHLLIGQELFNIQSSSQMFSFQVIIQLARCLPCSGSSGKTFGRLLLLSFLESITKNRSIT